MSTISSPVADVIAAQSQATAAKINIAVLGKQLDAQKQIGETINSLLKSTAQAQKQIGKGYLDVKV